MLASNPAAPPATLTYRPEPCTGVKHVTHLLDDIVLSSDIPASERDLVQTVVRTCPRDDAEAARAHLAQARLQPGLHAATFATLARAGHLLNPAQSCGRETAEWKFHSNAVDELLVTIGAAAWTVRRLPASRDTGNEAPQPGHGPCELLEDLMERGDDYALFYLYGGPLCAENQVMVEARVVWDGVSLAVHRRVCAESGSPPGVWYSVELLPAYGGTADMAYQLEDVAGRSNVTLARSYDAATCDLAYQLVAAYTRPFAPRFEPGWTSVEDLLNKLKTFRASLPAEQWATMAALADDRRWRQHLDTLVVTAAAVLQEAAHT